MSEVSTTTTGKEYLLNAHVIFWRNRTTIGIRKENNNIGSPQTEIRQNWTTSMKSNDSVARKIMVTTRKEAKQKRI